MRLFGIPVVDLNFAGVINEIDFKYDHDGDDFTTEVYSVDATSYSARGPSSSPLEIESKGLKSTHATSSRAFHALEVTSDRAVILCLRGTPTRRSGCRCKHFLAKTY
jgi:hypothetical protein